MEPTPTRAVVTLGHSTRSLDEFLEILEAHRVSCLVDVRRFPGSRRFPHFGRDALAAALEARGIEYVHEPELGGRRSVAKDASDANAAWRVEAFRAYADYMATPTFQAALGRLIARVEAAQEGRPIAITCAEALPERCHRRLIADALVARGITVTDALDASRSRPHELPDFARVDAKGRVTYPA
jgi:uncharacterized protein (DUF488 family)